MQGSVEKMNLVALCVLATLLCAALAAPAAFPLPQPAGPRPAPREALHGSESAYYPVAYAYPAAYSYYPIAYWG